MCGLSGWSTLGHTVVKSVTSGAANADGVGREIEPRCVRLGIDFCACIGL
jgi:hypothetical protein